MYAAEIAIAGVMLVSCLGLFAAMARRNDRRRWAYTLHPAPADDRDSLARFHRIIGQ